MHIKACPNDLGNTEKYLISVSANGIQSAAATEARGYAPANSDLSARVRVPRGCERRPAGKKLLVTDKSQSKKNLFKKEEEDAVTRREFCSPFPTVEPMKV